MSKTYRYQVTASAVRKLFPRPWEVEVEEGSAIENLLELPEGEVIATLVYKHPLPEMLVEAYRLRYWKSRKQKVQETEAVKEELNEPTEQG